MVTMNDTTAEIAHYLLQIKAVKLQPKQPFTWASGWKSPIYCDNRKVLSYPKVRRIVTDAFVEKAKQFEPFTMVAGVATAGIAYGALVADALDLPFCYVRSKAKGHGMQNMIEGEVKGNERILVIEDLISTGGSSIKAVDALESKGCTIAGVLAIFTYEFPKAASAFEEIECKLDTLSNYSALLRQAIDLNYINESDLETLEAWRNNPGEWSK